MEVPFGNGVEILFNSGGLWRLNIVGSTCRRVYSIHVSPFPAGESLGVLSENQRIQPQGGEKHQPIPCGKEMGYFSCREMMQGLLCLRHQVLQFEVNENKRLKMDVQMLVRRKNVVVGELDLAVEVVAAAFLFEMKHIVLCCMTSFVLMLMLKAMGTRLRRRDAKAPRKVVILGAVMEFHVPSHRDKQHRKGHQ